MGGGGWVESTRRYQVSESTRGVWITQTKAEYQKQIFRGVGLMNGCGINRKYSERRIFTLQCQTSDSMT